MLLTRDVNIIWSCLKGKMIDMKKLIFALFICTTFFGYGQEESLSKLLEFSSMSEKNRKYILLTRWEPIGIEKEVSGSGHSLHEEISYTIEYEGKSYELKLGNSISVNGYDEDSEKVAEPYFELRLSSETEFTKWMNELKEFGAELDEFEEFNEVNWTAHFYSPLYKFERIFLTKKKVGNDFEYWIHVD